MLSKVKVIFAVCLFFCFCFFTNVGKANAYYGSGLGSYGLSGGYGGLSGSSLYGGLYGMSSLYGGGLYGGLSGMSSLYGGLYGGMMGGLYGMGSMMGGLYGGMYGGMMGGLYGMGSMMGGLYGGNLSSLALMSALGGGLTGSTTSTSIAAEQVGTWEGLWTTGLVSGPITLNLVEDPILGILSGFVQLLGNPTLGSLITVTGEALNSQVILSGSGIGLGGMTFTLDIVGILTTPETMEGNYTLINSTSLVETGAFEAALLAPVL